MSGELCGAVCVVRPRTRAGGTSLGAEQGRDSTAGARSSGAGASLTGGGMELALKPVT